MGWFTKKSKLQVDPLSLSWKEVLNLYDSEILRHWIRHHAPHGGLNFSNGRWEMQSLNLSSLNLSNSNFEGVWCPNLCGADLTNANFNKVMGNGSNFAEACLNGANFARAYLENAKLFGASLIDTNFVNADLSGVAFVPAQLAKAKNIEHALLSPGYLADAVAAGYVLMKDRK